METEEPGPLESDRPEGFKDVEKAALRLDQTKLMYHPVRVSQWQAAQTWEHAKTLYPLYVEVSPVGSCNHRCTFCAVDYIGYKNVQLDDVMLRDRLREMGKLGVKSVMFAGEGEPLLHKAINSAVIAAKASGVDVSFTTNGVLLQKLETLDLCSWVKVSVNAGTRDTYAKVHRTRDRDWDRVWENIESAAKRKGNCTLGVQMVVLPENELEVDLLYAKAADAGVDYVVAKPYSQHKSSITREYESFRMSPFDVPERSGTKFYSRDDSFSHEPQSYGKCHATPNFWAYVMASGDVYSCSAYLLDERFKLGNLNESSFREVWEGERRRANWDFVRNGLDIAECRKNCRMDKANRYLWELTQGIQHQNFI